MADASRKDIPNTRGQCGRREDEEEVREGAAEITSHEPDQEREEGEEVGEEEEEGEEGEEEECEEPGEESPEEEVLLEWPAGVPQASVKDLAKLSYEEGVRNTMRMTVTSVFLSLSVSLLSPVLSLSLFSLLFSLSPSIPFSLCFSPLVFCLFPSLSFFLFSLFLLCVSFSGGEQTFAVMFTISLQ